ncbi:hypothetical protein Tco_1005627 [Tanacetum coccineum]|uniref:Uncharacterized protein n=1 Tax=Tanacetum coccineum TaxID=301880 RepID=A0ABQ5FGB0_9ASTR
MAPKNKDSRNKETTTRTAPIEETTSNALVSQCDGFGSSNSDTEELIKQVNDKWAALGYRGGKQVPTSLMIMKNDGGFACLW